MTLVRLCVELTRLGDGTGQPAPDDDVALDDPDDSFLGGAATKTRTASRAPQPPGPGPWPGRRLERAIIGKAVALLSGPGGLASFLRRQQLGASLAWAA